MSYRFVMPILFGLALIATTASAQTPGHHPRGINARERAQTARIRQGVRHGEISRAELNRLRAAEAAIRAEERLYRRTGNGLTPAERRDLNRDLNRTSRAITRARRNGR